MTVTVNEQTREIFPPRVRRQAGIRIGTKLEVKVSGGVITMLPLPAAGDEYTPGQRNKIDAELAASFEDVKHGRVRTFETAKEMIAFLHGPAKRPRVKGKTTKSR